MKIPLSRRLECCCSFVPRGSRVADIGCDHGYLSIALVTRGIAERVYAADVNEGPLQAAVINAGKYGVSEKIQFFLSDGVQNVPRDFDTLVCAGMGADVMISILRSAPWLAGGGYRLILQCQSRTNLLRQWLWEQGWQIRQETVLQDGRFLYTVMDVCWEPGVAFSGEDCWLSPALLRSGAPELPAYCRRLLTHLHLQQRGEPELNHLIEKIEKLAAPVLSAEE